MAASVSSTEGLEQLCAESSVAKGKFLVILPQTGSHRTREFVVSNSRQDTRSPSTEAIGARRP
jgi:hypothetical protein